MTAVLVVDDDSSFRALLRDVLEAEGHRVVEAADGAAALELLRRLSPDVVIADQRMPRLGGVELLREIRSRPAAPPVVLLTAYGTIPDAVDAVRLGAFDYLTKPLESPAALVDVVERALERSTSDDEFIADTRAMRDILDTADRAAERDVSVLITGESGTGKEVIARRIHAHSRRAQQPFIAVNCAALPETLAESELFGHERGAFTGAERQRAGRFEEATRGTLLLDEVGDLPLLVQAKLLRALEERTIRRLGGSKEIPIDIRLLAATNRDLQASIAGGTFRRDLFFRLAVVTIHIPPLRERPGDIEPIAVSLTRQLASRYRQKVPVLTPAALDALRSYEWPGNIRELRNVLERAIVLSREGEIDVTHLRMGEVAAGSLGSLRATSEKEAILDALRRGSGNREAAAALLGVSVRTLYYKLRRLGLN